MDFMTQVANVGQRMTTREQLMGYYQQKYPQTWNKRLSTDVQKFTAPDKQGRVPTIGSIARQFQKRGGRFTTPSARSANAYEALGKTLPKMQPERGYHVKGKVCISIEGYPCEERQWDYKVIGENANFLYKTGSLQGLVNNYMAELFDTENPSAELCDDEDACNSKVKVTALSVRGARTLRNIDQSWS